MFIGGILSTLVQLYIYVIILQVVMSWLIAFDVVNANNQAARNLMTLLRKLTDPVYKPIQKYVPPIGGIDLTPLIVIIGLQILVSLVFRASYGFIF